MTFPLAVRAQDDDRGRLIGFLESQLSAGPDRQVRIDGFRGVLSSQASLDRLTISDADGAWLILEDATLDWRRAALLTGALEVQALTAERLILRRPPLPAEGPDLPPAEATPFSLPELPVSIDIGQIAIDTVDLGAPVLGEAASLGVSGRASLAGGSGQTALRLERLDGPRGTFRLEAAFDNETRVLDLGLLLDEAEGGLAAGILGIPDEPPLRLEVAGEGPLSDIEVALSLAADGVERLDGTVRSTQLSEAAGQRVDVDLSGDLSPLLAPEYRPFFGASTEVNARVLRTADGATRLEEMRLATAALLLRGDVALDPQGRPVAIDVSGRIARPDGSGPVRLPVPGVMAELASADVNFDFDAAEDDGYRLTARLNELAVDDLSIAGASIAGEGRITPSETGIAAVTSDLSAELSGLGHADPALNEALGSSLTLVTQAAWSEGEPLRMNDLSIVSGGLTAGGTIAARIGGGRLPVTFDLSAGIEALSRFSAIAGQDLSGSLRAGLEGSAEALSGAFDIVLDGSARNLGVSPALPSELLSGETRLRLAAARDETGTRIETLNLDGTQLSLDASGRVSSGEGNLTADARLADLGLFTPAVRGPATASVELSRMGGDGWDVDATLLGPVGLRADVRGTVGLEGGRMDVETTGTVPLALANRFIEPQSVTGTMRFDLALDGQPDLEALTGRLSTSDARLAAPTAQLAVENIALNASLQGGRASLEGGGTVSTGGQVRVTGALDLGAPGLPGNIGVTLDRVRLLDPTLYEVLVARGDLTFGGALARSPGVAGRIELGESELRVPETGLGTAAPIPDIRHVDETAAERRTRAAAGLLQRQAAPSGGGTSAVGLDIEIAAPGRIFLRGRGIDAEFGGSLRVGGTTANVIPAGRFDLIRGRISILGTRLDITEGSATLQGDFDPFLRLRAESRAGGYRIIIAVDGPASSPDISLSSDPFLPEDEILAQLLFGRSVSSLSPVQLIQLADAASSLAGGRSDGGLLSNLREGLGLDNLDLQTDDEGNAAVRAGRYLNENIYTDVTVGAQGDSAVSLNIDLTPDVTARGSFSSDGSSSVGVFFERDY